MFRLEKEGSYRKERAGVLLLARGEVRTPVFMPVGTQGMVKSLSFDELLSLDYKLMLANAYHLYLRPGLDVIEKFSGLHNFTKWDRNILTDSGGYQGFSLGLSSSSSSLSRVEEGGILFRSHIDGSKHLFSPSKVLSIQETLGSQIVMPIDVCLARDASHKDAMYGHGRTLEWARESISIAKGKSYILMGITQGGVYSDIRKLSIEALVELDFPGYALGGLSVGEDKALTREMVDLSTDHLPKEKPRYLMGVGKPTDIIRGVEYGVDMFDSVYPTRIARNASVFTKEGVLILTNSINRLKDIPIDDVCTCYVCKSYSRSYLRHLFKAGELLALRLATYHNLHFLNVFMKRIRASIIDGTFKELRREFLLSWSSSD